MYDPFFDILWRAKPMTVKEYLSQTFIIDQAVECKLRLSESLSSQAMRFDPESGGRAEENRKSIYEKIRALEEEIDSDIDRLVDLKAEIYALIEKIKDPREKILLTLRYMTTDDGKRPTWAYIAAYLGYDERWIMRLHQRALKSAAELYEKQQK